MHIARGLFRLSPKGRIKNENIFAPAGNPLLRAMSLGVQTQNRKNQTQPLKSHSLQAYLIDRCKRGDRKAQNELYRLYAGAMYHICRRMCGDEEVARDLLQDAFVDAFSKLHSLQEAKVFAAWIKRIVVNKCINHLRKRDFTEELRDDYPHEEEDQGEFTSMQAQRVMQAIDKLPVGCRTVLNLYLFDGYDHGEIAGILGITEAASKSQYCKAKARIRSMIETQVV